MLAVAVLTGLWGAVWREIGVSCSPRGHVLRLASLGRANGMDGVVCSAHEITALRQEMGPAFKLIVPGIRPAGSAVNDQKRIMTPVEAQTAGADILVIGRPITSHQNPAQAAPDIAASLRAGDA